MTRIRAFRDAPTLELGETSVNAYDNTVEIEAPGWDYGTTYRITFDLDGAQRLRVWLDEVLPPSADNAAKARP